MHQTRLKKILHQVGSFSISSNQKQVGFKKSSRIISLLVESETSQIKHKYQFTVAMYTFDALSCHQMNLLFLIFTRDLGILLNIFSMLTQSATCPH